MGSFDAKYLYKWLLVTSVFLISTGCHYVGVNHIQQVTLSEKETNRYEAAGIDNPAEFEAVFRKVQELVQKNDKEALVPYIQFPLNVYTNGKKLVPSSDQAQFLANYNLIFTPKVKQALVNQDVKQTFVNAQGVMAGDGEVWFGVINSTPQKYLVITINN